MQDQTTTPARETVRKRVRRLRPEVAAALAARKRETQLEELYAKPVDELRPEEVEQMRAAFFGA